MRDYRIEVIGHASLRAQDRGKTLVADPWWLDPIGPNSAFHFPPLAHDVGELVRQTDFLYISHIHPDHFHLPTLALLPKTIPVYIGAYRRKGFRDAIARLGFPVIECPFQEPVAIPGTDFEIAILEHDYLENAAYDSALVVRTPAWTLFNNNDAVLAPEKYDWVRRHYDVDYAFLGFSPASFYPLCFDMDEAEKQRLMDEAAERRFADFVQAAQRLQPRIAIPFASGARFLQDGARWKNISFNAASDAVRRVEAVGLRGEAMGPGDRITADDRFERVQPPRSKADELADAEHYARTHASYISMLSPPDPPARPGLVERFRDYLLERWRQTRAQLPGVSGTVIAYVVRGTEEQRFYFDFSQPEEEIFHWGTPPHYDMLYRYPAGGLQRRLDGEIDWDDLHFTNDVSVHQVRYARDFYAMLRSEVLDLERLRAS